MNDITKRFIELYNYLLEKKIVKNASDFSQNVGISSSLMNEILKGRSNVGIKPIQNTVLKYPYHISTDWLITGDGKRSPGFIMPELIDKNPSEELAIKTVGIPLIPIDAVAGFGEGNIQVMDYDCEYYVVPEFTELKVDFMIRVKGSSMYPKYSSGDIVACKKLSLNNIFFQWNKVYVLNTEQGALIKRIKKSKNDNHILIVSENPKYDDFELHLSKINAIAIVVGVIRLE